MQIKKNTSLVINSPKTMKIKIIISLLIVCIITLGSIFYLKGKHFTVHITEAQILKKLDEKAPFKKTYLTIFKTVIQNPRVHIKDNSERISVGADVTVNINIKKYSKKLSGTIDVLTGISYNNETHQFFLVNPEIEKISMQGIPDKYVSKVNSIVNKALQKYLAETVVYKLKADSKAKTVAKMILKSIRVKNKNVIVTLGI